MHVLFFYDLWEIRLIARIFVLLPRVFSCFARIFAPLPRVFAFTCLFIYKAVTVSTHVYKRDMKARRLYSHELKNQLIPC